MLTTIPSSLARLCRHLTSSCWKCGFNQQQTIICNGCGALQPDARSLNYFTLMDVPESHEVDSGKLKKRYNMLQARVHPDVIHKELTASNTPPGLLQMAEALSAKVNRAYDVLRDDMRRAEYIASLYNISSAAAPPALLIDQMVLRDQIAAIYQKRDGCRLIEMRRSLIKRFAATSDLFGKALKAKDSTQMSNLLCEMRFLTSTLTELKSYISRLDMEDMDWD